MELEQPQETLAAILPVLVVHDHLVNGVAVPALAVEPAGETDVPADDEVATRIANSIGPAFDGFAPIAGTLPFDLEPASFLLAQIAKVSK